MTLSEAIDQYSQDAGDLFTTAQAAMQGASGDALKHAQGQLSAAFRQLGQAAEMASDEAGRKGFADVVRLMQITTDAARDVCTRVQKIANNPAVPSNTDIQLLGTLGFVLQSLAQLSPSHVWQKTPTDSAAG
jgi:hypothetical protein